MAKWFEGAEEAAFKPVAGGYVLQLPNRWFIGRSQRYLVNEDQKAAIAAILRGRQRLLLPLLASYFLLIVALVIALSWSAGSHGLTVLSGVIAASFVVLSVALLVLAPHIYTMRKLGPALATLPATDQHITFPEQIANIAKAMPRRLLIVVFGGAVLMVVGNLMALADAIHEGRLDHHLLWSLISLLMGMLLCTYFAYLTVLRRRLERNAA